MSDINITIEDTPIDVDINAAASIDTTNINVDSTQCPVQSVNGKIGFVNLTYEDLGFPSGVVSSGDLNNYYLKSNPSGFITSQNVVFTTGGAFFNPQIIGGYNNFSEGLKYKSSEVATLDNISTLYSEFGWSNYTYDRTVITLGYGNYIMGWTPSWNSQIPTGKNIQIQLNNINYTTDGGNNGGLANVTLPQIPSLNDKVRVIASGFNGWTLNIYVQTGILETVTNTSSINKRFTEFIYTNNGWKLNSPPYHLHTKSEISDLEPIPDIENGYFYRPTDAINRGGYMGQAPYQVVLAGDTRLSDSRPVRYRYVGNQIPISPNPTGSFTGIVGDMAYDGANLYILLPQPGGQDLKWGRVAVASNWS